MNFGLAPAISGAVPDAGEGEHRMKIISIRSAAVLTVALLASGSAMAQTAYDDQVCRQWASQNASYAQAQADNDAAGKRSAVLCWAPVLAP